jgi:hypothetical protein
MAVLWSTAAMPVPVAASARDAAARCTRFANLAAAVPLFAGADPNLAAADAKTAMPQRPLPASQMPSDPPTEDAVAVFEVRSITGACYTIVEELAADGTRTYRTAYARLPVVANDDGTFTIVDTETRLVRVDTPAR